MEPEGLTAVLTRIHREYGPAKILITENGAAFEDEPGVDGFVQDDRRVAYLREHLAAANRALDQGVPLAGYFAWSLLDNFEWAEGYAKRFGVVGVDFPTQARTPKASARWFADLIARSGGGSVARPARPS